MNGKNVMKYLALTMAFLLAGVTAHGADGAYVGNEKCRECHPEYLKTFAATVHGKAGEYGEKDTGCESCHGPGGSHSADGNAGMIVNPRKVDAEAASAGCLKCHSKGKGQMFWYGSVHAGQGISCVGCHRIHGNNTMLLADKSENELCVKCHMDVRADLIKRSKHPLRDSAPFGQGKMSCSSCHNPHGARGEKLIEARSINDKCYECHFEKKAPVLWEHSPVKEDCLTCHSAHGSSNDKLLVSKIPRLCQQCHMQGRHQSGALGPDSIFAFNRGCLNCHPQVHGSNNPSGTVLQR